MNPLRHDANFSNLFDSSHNVIHQFAHTLSYHLKQEESSNKRRSLSLHVLVARALVVMLKEIGEKDISIRTLEGKKIYILNLPEGERNLISDIISLGRAMKRLPEEEKSRTGFWKGLIKGSKIDSHERLEKNSHFLFITNQVDEITTRIMNHAYLSYALKFPLMPLNFIHFLHSDKSTFFSLIPRDVVNIVYAMTVGTNLAIVRGLGIKLKDITASLKENQLLLQDRVKQLEYDTYHSLENDNNLLSLSNSLLFSYFCELVGTRIPVVNPEYEVDFDRLYSCIEKSPQYAQRFFDPLYEYARVNLISNGVFRVVQNEGELLCFDLPETSKTLGKIIIIKCELVFLLSLHKTKFNVFCHIYQRHNFFKESFKIVCDFIQKPVACREMIENLSAANRDIIKQFDY